MSRVNSLDGLASTNIYVNIDDIPDDSVSNVDDEGGNPRSNVPPPRMDNPRGEILQQAVVNPMNEEARRVNEGNAEYVVLDENPQMDGANLEAELRASVPRRDNGVKRAFARAFMTVCQFVKRLFSFRPSACAVSEFNAELKAKLESNDEEGSSRARVATISENEKAGAITYTPGEMAAAFSVPATTPVQFTGEEIQEIRQGEFNLDDIKQNPDFQDCWFLSSLASVMASKGAKGISNLIRIPEPTDGYAYVTLHGTNGDELYKVPLATIEGSVSNSKPWVRLMENAMQMYMINHAGFAMRDATMYGGNPKNAFRALLGVNPGNVTEWDESTKIADGDHDPFFEEINAAIAAHKPVVLLTSGSKATALSSGISKGHAVTVMGVGKGRVKNHLLVMDPYGSMKLVSRSEVKGCKIQIANDEEL